MTKFKLLTAAAVLSTVIAAPAMAEQQRHHANRDRGPVGAAADVAGAAIGTAGAIATAPFRNSYAYDRNRTTARTASPVTVANGSRAETGVAISVNNAT